MSKKLINKQGVIDAPLFNVLLFSILWGINIFIAKLAFEAGAEPVAFEFQITFIALIFLSIFVLPKKYKELKSTSANVIGNLFLANTARIIGGVFASVGIALTFAVNASFLLKFSLVTTAVFARIFLKEKLTLSKILAIVAMFIGLFLITTKGELIVPKAGDIFLIFACLSWTFASILVRKNLKNSSVSGELVSFLRPLPAIPLILIMILLSPLYPEPIRSLFSVNIFDLSFISFIVPSGFIAACIWFLLNRTLKVASASYVNMMSMITPVIVSILAILFLGERMEIIQIVGAFLIIISGIVTHYTKVDKQ